MVSASLSPRSSLPSLRARDTLLENSMPLEYGWTGVFPATLCPFHADESIDERGLHDYIRELAATPGVNGLTCNGHTGEIMSLPPRERDQVTRIVPRAVRSLPPRRVVNGAHGN